MQVEQITNYLKKALTVLFLFVAFSSSIAQIDTNLVVSFDFNEGVIKEKNNLVKLKPVGVTLTEDRFGNDKSALYVHGHRNSYLNLSASPLLKQKTLSVSLWVRVDMKNFFGKGYPANPIIITRNSENEDFTISYGLFYEYEMNRFSFSAMRDSVKSVAIFPDSKVELTNWYHIVFSYNTDSCFLYVNGKLEGASRKDFITSFNPKDSVLIGHSGSEKNQRYFFGAIDDIKFFNKVITSEDVLSLYNASNPNRVQNFIRVSLKYLLVIVGLIALIIILIIRNKRALIQQKEKLELVNKISELELKVVKAQMNPHFISNCIAAIQELIYINEIDKAAQYLAKFSFFLRQVLYYSDKNFISIEDELEIIKLNVELEQLRFKNKFSYELIVSNDVDVANTYIPSLITQPFIENAIWHGLLPLNNERNAELNIRIYKKDNLPIIEIEDNGVGRKDRTVKGHISKGTKLVEDKIESLNKLSESSNYRLCVLDLSDDKGNALGTKVLIQLEDIKYE